MENKFRDFDEFFNEVEETSPIKIKLYDKEYTLPSELPASTILEAYRAAKAGQTEISDAKQMEMAMEMMGETNVEEWCENGLTIKQLTEIMGWVFKQHQSSDGAGGKK